jgi:hypothetical protein
MLTLIDGPCKGAYLVKRSPMFLRAVQNAKGENDLLDQIEDTPAEDEKIYVYLMEGNPGTIHIHGAKVHGWYALAQYHYLPNVDGETLRDNVTWQAWATEQMKKV